MPNQLAAEIKTVIDTALGAFNSKKATVFNSTFGGDVVIVDGMAPYRWTGPNAQGRWFADAEKWAHQLDVTSENIAYDKVVHAEVIGQRAYVVLSATLSFMLKGKPGARKGTLVYILARQGNDWKIESQSWGRLS
ncbi:MAG TPA: hypothetical protein VEY94_09000 [Patescibacteria group bacterium]|nr:hypothetical protein [Patescibacteria group bacterium]